MTAFLIIDDHPLFGEALGNALRRSREGARLFEARSIEGALDILACEAAIDLALLDLSLPDAAGFSGFQRLRAAHPRLPVAIVSSEDDPRLIREALSLGAAGYLPKSVSMVELAGWIERVLQGSISVPADFVTAVERPDADAAQALRARVNELTPQQLRVLDLIRHGLPNRQIAAELHLAESTVKAHVTEILRKLKLFSRNKAVIEVGRLGLPVQPRAQGSSPPGNSA